MLRSTANVIAPEQDGKTFQDRVKDAVVEKVVEGDSGMAGDQFRVQELNPFMEWHLPTNLFQVFRCQEQENRRER